MRYLSYHEKKVRGTFDFPIELYYVDSSHPRYEMPFHWHMETELLLVLSGKFELISDGGSFNLSSGESAFIPAGVLHGGNPDNCIYECIVFDAERFFQDSNICRERFYEAYHGSEPGVSIYSVETRVGRVISGLFEAMEREYECYEFITTGLLWQLMGLLLRKCGDVQSKHRPVRTEQIKDVLRRIRSDYNKNLTLDQLAKEANMSPRYFCRAFRSVTGRTPVDYLNYYRIECAAELLLTTSESVTEIALSCGFEDSGYFARTFKKYKNCSPSSFRSHTEGG